MEENMNRDTQTIKRNGTIVLCTTLFIGYIIGRISNNQIAVESYKKGVSDTLSSIVFTQR